MKSHFAAIRKGKVHEEVARQIEKLILEKLHPGDKLPSERELTELLGVSRSSIRDGLRRLELVGMVEPRQGAGTVVREISPDVLVSPLAKVISNRKQMVAELLDFRKMLEPPLAARAARNATKEDIVRMEDILRRQAEKLRGGSLAVEEDSEFHYAISTASGNSVVLKVLDVIMDMLRETRAQSLQTAGRPQKSIAGHRRIMTAIKRRNGPAAEKAMQQHLKEVEGMVLKKS